MVCWRSRIKLEHWGLRGEGRCISDLLASLACLSFRSLWNVCWRSGLDNRMSEEEGERRWSMWSTVGGNRGEGETTEDHLLQKLGEIGWLGLEEGMDRWRSSIRLLASLAWLEKFLKWIYNWIKTIFPMNQDSRNEHWKILNVNNYCFKCNWLSE